MPAYYMLLEASTFRNQIRPALAASWRLRSFKPCRDVCADVSRLCDYLADLNPLEWTAAGLSALREAADEQDREEELEIAREWFPALLDLYQRAKSKGEMIICEIL